MAELTKYMPFLLFGLILIYFMSHVSAQRRHPSRDYGVIVPQTRGKNITRTTAQPSLSTKQTPLATDEKQMSRDKYPDRFVGYPQLPSRTSTKPPYVSSPRYEIEPGRRGNNDGIVVFPDSDPYSTPSSNGRNKNKEKKKNNKNKNKIKGRHDVRFWPNLREDQEQTE